MRINEPKLSGDQLYGLADDLRDSYGNSHASFPEIDPGVMNQWIGETYRTENGATREKGAANLPTQSPTMQCVLGDWVPVEVSA